MTRIQKLAHILLDGEWHTSTDLVKEVGHRFGAAILDLRKGKFDGEHWVIEGEQVVNQVGVWKYRHVGFAGRYRTKAPICPKCGTKRLVEDARATGSSGEADGVTTVRQSTLLGTAWAEVARLNDLLEWQAAIIKSLEYKLAHPTPHPTSRCGGAVS